MPGSSVEGAVWHFFYFYLLFLNESADSDYEMDIRSINNFITNTIATNRAETEKKADIKSDASNERDANGQLGRQPEESPRELSEDELKKVVEVLKTHQGVKSNNLQVELKLINGKYFVLIEDPSGKVIRRVAANDLWQVLKDSDKDLTKGRIFNKAL